MNPTDLAERHSETKKQNDSRLTQDIKILQDNKALNHNLNTITSQFDIVAQEKSTHLLEFGTLEQDNIILKRELKTDRAGLSKAVDDSKSAKDNAKSHKRDRNVLKNSTDRVSWSWKKKSKKISSSAINMLMAAVSKPENVDLLKGLIGVAEIVFKFFSV